ncbi:cytochrome P450 [Parasphingopyxis marina]|uniref:Cytochrome P450 n=1 Tax=Parasphingopyxis marina TaxID=2761622 RepID=A0A842HTF7_9SPHN|nr:cytochrome P450 [Parasphingopyxis marina]MBC2777188.1 cytochrome P450 [Parasphingopyxis marina]
MTIVSDIEPAPLEDSVSEWLALNSDSRLDRWDVYARLREEAPIFDYGDQTFLSRHKDCVNILRDHKTYLSGFDPEGERVMAVMASLDPEKQRKYREVLDHQLRWLTSSNAEKHVALRSLATRVFSMRAIENMRERIQREVDERLDELEPRDSIEIISEFAYQLPLTIISEMLDIPIEVRESIHKSWQSMTQLIGNPPERVPEVIDTVHAGMAELESRLQHTFDTRRGQQTTDLLARLLDAENDESGIITDKDIMGIVAQMVIAGHQTTQDTIGNALLELFGDRDQWRAICEEPELIPNAVEEVLRLRSPGQMVNRISRTDTVIGEREIPAGTRLTCLLASANRDAAVFDDPDRFDIRRENARQHLAFSSGVHFCLGASLSRMELQIFLETFSRRFPDADLADSHVEWLPNNFLLGLKELHVRFR